MNIYERAKGVLTRPRETWLRIAARPSSPRELFLGYAAVLALIPPLANLAATLFLYRRPTSMGLGGTHDGLEVATAALGYVLELAVVFGMSEVAAFFAQRFGGRRDTLAAMKLVVHAATPVWVLGILGLISGLGLLSGAVGLLWSIYLIFLGAPAVMGVPPGKAGGFTGVVTLIWLVGYLAAAGLASLFAGVLFPQSY